MYLNFTQNNLIAYLYNESNELTTEHIEYALATNWQLKETFEELSATRDAIGTAKHNPSDTSIAIILKHSKETARQVHFH